MWLSLPDQSLPCPGDTFSRDLSEENDEGRTAGEMRAAAARARTAMTQEYLLTQHAHVLSFEQKVEAHDNLRHMGVVKQWHVPNTVTAVQALTPPPEPPLRVPQGPRSAAYQPPPPEIPPSRTASALAWAMKGLEDFDIWNTGWTDPKQSQNASSGLGSSLWLTRAVVLRGVGVALALAFLRLAQEQRVVLASDGVAPASYHPSPSASVFALLGFGDWQLQLVSWGGLFLALMLVGLTVHWFALPLILWLAYLSVLSLEGGLAPTASWELQTLEMSFLGIFLSPAAPSLTPYHLGCPPLITTLLLFRFLAFRATLGAGISGMFDRGTWESSGGAPSLGAWVLHHTVPHLVEVLRQVLVKLARLVLPFTLLVPIRKIYIGGALALILLNAADLVATGNLCKYVAMLVSLLACLDDEVLVYAYQPSAALKALRKLAPLKPDMPYSLPRGSGPSASHPWAHRASAGLHLCLMIFMAESSFRPLFHTLTAGRHLSTTPFGKYMFVNAYGADEWRVEASSKLQRARLELVLSYTHDGHTWRQVNAPCAPRRTASPPCAIPQSSRVRDRVREDTLRWAAENLDAALKDDPRLYDASPLHAVAAYASRNMTELDAHSWGGPVQEVSPLAADLCTRIMAGHANSARALEVAPLDVFQPSPPQGMMAQVFVYKFSNMSAWWQGRKGLQDWAWWERGAVWGPVRCGRSAPKSQKGSSAIVHHTQASIAFDQLLLISILGAVSCCSALLMGYWQEDMLMHVPLAWTPALPLSAAVGCFGRLVNAATVGAFDKAVNDYIGALNRFQTTIPLYDKITSVVGIFYFASVCALGVSGEHLIVGALSIMMLGGCFVRFAWAFYSTSRPQSSSATWLLGLIVVLAIGVCSTVERAHYLESTPSGLAWNKPIRSMAGEYIGYQVF